MMNVLFCNTGRFIFFFTMINFILIIKDCIHFKLNVFKKHTGCFAIKLIHL